MATELIADRIDIARRYVRAVDIARDLDDARALEGYVVTPSVRDGLKRVVAGVGRESSQRAFRVTGPYGSGKSSFGLFLARLFHEGSGGGDATNLLHSALGEQDVPAYRAMVLVGRRASFAEDLAEVVWKVAREEFGERDELTIAAKELRENQAAGRIDVKPVLDSLGACSERVCAMSGRGLLLLIDELGRYVEFAACNPGREDPSVFQQLAELAGGVRDNGLGVIGFLHHRFADYVATLGDWLEGEWMRSSERYEEIAFHESHEQLLYLLSKALVPRRPHGRAVRLAARLHYGEAGKRGLFALQSDDLLAIGEQLYPLHAGALACLCSCSRRFGQNERSAFGFLQSSEPFGYQDFAHRTVYGSRHWYRVDDVYDYLASQGGFRFQSKDRERRWELSQDAVVACGDMQADVLRVLKAVSLVAVLEPVPGLSAEVDTLAWLLGCTHRVVGTALAELATRGVVHKRESRGDWSLWSHSSVDLDRWMGKAKGAIPEMRRLDEDLCRNLPVRPIVAQRHYQRTGTLRSFAVRVGKAVKETGAGTDGVVLVRPVYPDEDPEQAMREGTETSKRLGALAVVRMQPIAREQLAIARNLACWRWVQANCDELRIDDFARAEVGRRIRDLESELRIRLLPFAQASMEAEGVEWIRDGEAVAVKSRAGLNRFLSRVCDEVFFNAPILRNELINRDKLSAAVAAARMRLLGLMLSAEEHEYLGLAGAPPERTIYLSMFHASGMHRAVNGGLRFGYPQPLDTLNWGPAWRKVDSIAQGSESVRFDKFIAGLGEAPIGLRAGPALLLITAYMLHHRGNIALMERGSFQPEINQAHFMRLAKSPKNFALRRIGASENDMVLRSLVEGLSIWADERPEVEIKAIVQALYRWWRQLPEFARRTRSVSARAQNVRTVLGKAREPIGLMLDQLPQVCEAVDQDGINCERYTRRLNVVLGELDEALPRLRGKVEACTLRGFGTRTLVELRRQVFHDYKDHVRELGSYELRAFVERALNQDRDIEGWIDGIAGLVVGKRLESWDDSQIDHFSLEIRGVAQKLSRRLSLMRKGNGLGFPVSAVHLTTSDGAERSLFFRNGADGDEELRERIRAMLGEAKRPDAVLVDLLGEVMGEESPGSVK